MRWLPYVVAAAINLPLALSGWTLNAAVLGFTIGCAFMAGLRDLMAAR